MLDIILFSIVALCFFAILILTLIEIDKLKKQVTKMSDKLNVLENLTN